MIQTVFAGSKPAIQKRCKTFDEEQLIFYKTILMG